MGAVPKRKTSKAKRNRRRANHALDLPAMSICPKCNKAKRPHFVCGYCGFYGVSQQVRDSKEVISETEK